MIKDKLGDPNFLNKELNKAIRDALVATKANIEKRRKDLSKVPVETQERYLTEISRAEYVRGLFVTNLRRSLIPLSSAATYPLTTVFEKLTQTSNWRDAGIPECRFNTYEYICMLDSNKKWHVTYSMLVDMCNGVWTPESEEGMTVTHSITDEIQQDISQLELLTQVAENTLNLFPLQIEAIKRVGEEADRQHREIYS